MHEEELDVTGVLDEEGLVAGGHHVLGLLVATISDLYRRNTLVFDTRCGDRHGMGWQVPRAWECCS